MKQCKKCLHWKPLDEFYRRKDTKDRRHGSCIKCHNAGIIAARWRRIEQHRAWAREYQKRPEVRERLNDYKRLFYMRKKRLALQGK